MIFLLHLASIPVLVSATTTVDPAAGQVVTAKKNGEFLAKNYPPRALAAGEQGKVGFRIVVEPDGTLGTCEITESSGFQSLDNETCEIIVRNAKLPVIRNANGRAVRSVQNGYINWVHPTGAKSAAPVETAEVSNPDKIICKKTAATGSLIRRTKQCMTARQWGEMYRIARNEADRLVAKGYYSDGMGCKALTNPSGECN